MHNLLANTPRQKTFGQGYFVRQVDPRTKTYHHTLYNNIFAGSFPVLSFNYPSHRSGEQRIDYNVYDVADTARAFCVNAASDDPSPWTNVQFFSLIKEELGREASGLKFDNQNFVPP